MKTLRKDYDRDCGDGLGGVNVHVRNLDKVNEKG